MKTKLASIIFLLLLTISCKSQEENQLITQVKRTDNSVKPVNSQECITEQQVFNLPKVENKIEGELDYTTNELQLVTTQYNRDETVIGKITKDGIIHFNLPEVDLKAIYKEINMIPATLESMFEMYSCMDDDMLDTNYKDIYPQKYDIDIKLYGISVARLLPVSGEKMFKNLTTDNTHNDVIGSQYYFYNIDQDVDFNLECKQNSFSGIYDIELTRNAKIHFNKGWNFIKETIVQTQKYTKGDYTTEIPKKITYSNVNYKDKNIKWYIDQMAKEEDIILIKKLYYATPVTEKEFRHWAPNKLIDLPQESIVYGKPPKNRKNTNNIHLVYSNEAQKRDVDVYIIDSAHFPETYLQANYIYEMEGEFGDKKKKLEYVSKYNKDQSTSKIIYKVNERFVVEAEGYNMKPDELWAYIQKLNVEKLIP